MADSLEVHELDQPVVSARHHHDSFRYLCVLISWVAAVATVFSLGVRLVVAWL